MSDEIRSIIAEVLDEGRDDWVTVGHVLHRASIHPETSQHRARSVTIAALSILIENELAIAGNIGDSGFEAWELGSQRAIERIRLECEAREWNLGLTDVWLATTATGDKIAHLIDLEGEGVLDRFFDFMPRA